MQCTCVLVGGWGVVQAHECSGVHALTGAQVHTPLRRSEVSIEWLSLAFLFKRGSLSESGIQLACLSGQAPDILLSLPPLLGLQVSAGDLN